MKFNLVTDLSNSFHPVPKENLIEVCRICHTKIHTGEIKINTKG